MKIKKPARHIRHETTSKSAHKLIAAITHARAMPAEGGKITMSPSDIRRLERATGTHLTDIEGLRPSQVQRIRRYGTRGRELRRVITLLVKQARQEGASA